jgi:hypothetical protein
MSSFNLKVNVKDHKLNVKPEILQSMRPVFNVSAQSYSVSTSQRRINHEPIEGPSSTQQLTGGETQKQQTGQTQKPSTESQQVQKSQGQQTQVEKHHEDKTSIDITMRDGNSGEFLARGHLEFDPSKRKETKYEEKVSLTDLWGNEIGHAVVDIEQEKLSEKDLGFDKEFRQMRNEMKKMMKDTNRLFGNFSRRFLGRNYGFDLLDDFRSMMLEDSDQPFRGWGGLSMDTEEPRQIGSQQQSGSQSQSGTKPSEVKGSQTQKSGQSTQQTQPSGMQQQQKSGTQPEDMSRRTQDKKSNVEITEEKPIA